MARTNRMLVWSIEATAGFDTAWASLDADRLTAEGRVAALLPRPHWATYRLETSGGWVTSRMTVEARGKDGLASLDVACAEGRWRVDGVERPDLDGALDVDLAGCPLTNTMPILRHRLHEREGDRELRMAFITVPSLRVVVSIQRYTHVGRLPNGLALVRYRSGSFESELTIDRHGFVVDYPKLGRRVEPPPRRRGDGGEADGAARAG